MLGNLTINTGQFLGKGGFGSVYTALDTKEKAAVKTMEIKNKSMRMLEKIHQ